MVLLDIMAVVSFSLDVMDQIYGLYKAVKDGDDLFQATYERACSLIAAIDGMEDADKLPLQSRLEELLVVTRELLEYLDQYKQFKKDHKVKHAAKKLFHASDLAARIDRFNREVEALFQLYNLAIGAQMMKCNNELVRGMRELLQGAKSGAEDDYEDDALALKRGLNGGPKDAATDVTTLIKRLADATLAEEAALELCEMAEKDADAFMQTDAIQSLVDMLTSGGEHECWMAVRVLYRLARQSKYEIAIVEAGAVERLSELLQGGKSDKSAVCATLARLVVQADHKKQFLESDGLLKDVVVLVHNGSSMQKLRATTVLGQLAENDLECARRIAKLKAIPVLIDLLYVGETLHARLAALRALWNLSSLRDNRTAVVEEGGVPAIVEQLRNGDSDTLRQLAASTLAVLAQDDAHDPLIGNAGAIAPLVRLLISGTSEQQNSSVWALAELANHSGNAAKIMEEAGAARALMAAFRSAPDVQRRAKAGVSLTWLAQYAQDKATLANQLGLKSIARLLVSGSTDQKQNAARVLRFLVEDASVRTKVKGAIASLIELIERHTPKQPAMDALRAFVQGENEDAVRKCRECIIEAQGVKVLTKALATFADYYPRDHAGAKVHPDRDDSEEFASAAMALQSIAVSDRTTIKQLVDSHGVDIALHALDKGTQEMQLRAAAFVVGFTRQCHEIQLRSKETKKCVVAFTGLLQQASTNQVDGRLIVYAANGLLVHAAANAHKKSYHHQADLFSPTIYTILVRHIDDRDLKNLSAEAIYLLASQPSTIQLTQVRGLKRVVKALEDTNEFVADSAMRALIAWSNEPSNLAVLGDIGANKAVSRAMQSDDSKLVDAALEMLGKLPQRDRWNGLTATGKENVLKKCFERCRSSFWRDAWTFCRAAWTLAKIYEALEAFPRVRERQRREKSFHSAIWEKRKDSFCSLDDEEEENTSAENKKGDEEDDLSEENESSKEDSSEEDKEDEDEDSDDDEYSSKEDEGDEDEHRPLESFLDRVREAGVVEHFDHLIRYKLGIKFLLALARGDEPTRRMVAENAGEFKCILQLTDAPDDQEAAAGILISLVGRIRDVKGMVSPMLHLLFTHEKGRELVSEFVTALLYCRTSDTRDVATMALQKLVERAMVSHSDKASDAALHVLADLFLLDFDGGTLLVEACDIAIDNCAEVVQRAAEIRQLSASDERAIVLLGMLIYEPHREIDFRNLDEQYRRERAIKRCTKMVANRRLLRPLLKLLLVTDTGTLRGPRRDQHATHWWLLFVLKRLAIIDDASILVTCDEVVTLVDVMRTGRDLKEQEAAGELVAICVVHQNDALLRFIEAGLVGAFETLLQSSYHLKRFKQVLEAMAAVGTAEALAGTARLVQLVADIALVEVGGRKRERAIEFLESLTHVFNSCGDFGVVEKCASALQIACAQETEDDACRAARILAALASSRRCCVAMATSGAVKALVDEVCRSPWTSEVCVLALGEIAKCDATQRDFISTDKCLRTLLASTRSGVENSMQTLALLCKDPADIQRLVRLEPDLLEFCVEILDQCCDGIFQDGSFEFFAFLAVDESFGRAMASDERIVHAVVEVLRIGDGTDDDFVRLIGLLARHEDARCKMVGKGVEIQLDELLGWNSKEEVEKTMNALSCAAAAF